jgi:hypothetical protein
MMRPPYKRLKKAWGWRYARPRGPPADVVAALERKYDLVLPPDLRDYLLFAAPRTNAGMDSEFIEWWTADQIRNIPDGYEYPVADSLQPDAAGYLFFADLLVWCWAWAICCRGKDYGKVAVIGVERERFVADSFGAFVDLYVSDPHALGSDSTP